MESPKIRRHFNERFNEETHKKFLKNLNDQLPTPIPMRLAESPLFLSNEFRDRVIAAANHIMNFIRREDFKQITEKAIPDRWRCTNENDHPHIVTMDFAITKDEQGDFAPKLIELQGFPSLHGLEIDMSESYRSVYEIPSNWTIFFNDLTKEKYIELLRKTIVGRHQPDEVVLMDVNAPQQKTASDFYFHKKYLDIPIVSLSDLKQQDKQLFYERNGQTKRIKRIYNRLIFDEVADDPNLFKNNVDIRQDLDVEWVPHPNWYFRISKWILPLLQGICVLKTFYLSEILDNLPSDLENYVLKPLFSFGGSNVHVDVTKQIIENIKDPQNWILERKTEYEPVFREDNSFLKAEIRLMFLWPDDFDDPILTTPCTRLTPAKLINVAFTKNTKWAGSSVSFIQK